MARSRRELLKLVGASGVAASVGGIAGGKLKASKESIEKLSKDSGFDAESLATYLRDFAHELAPVVAEAEMVSSWVISHLRGFIGDTLGADKLVEVNSFVGRSSFTEVIVNNPDRSGARLAYYFLDESHVTDAPARLQMHLSELAQQAPHFPEGYDGPWVYRFFVVGIREAGHVEPIDPLAQWGAQFHSCGEFSTFIDNGVRYELVIGSVRADVGAGDYTGGSVRLFS